MAELVAAKLRLVSELQNPFTIDPESAAMNDLPQVAPAGARHLSWTVRFAIATWASTAALALIFALFWRMQYAPPHALWAMVTTGAVLVSAALTLIVGVYQALRGPRRALPTALVLLGTTPVVWSALYFWTLYWKAEIRGPFQRNVPMRIVEYWSASLGDMEARWRYPRWTKGQYVVLLDDGQTPNPSRLVAQMDQQVEQMAARLHVPLPNRPARWVRGPLLGRRGQELNAWAICDVENHSPELTYIDRHEVAHVMMAMSGSPDQYPSTLLSEGWAESQSKERAKLILALAARLEQGTNYSLQQLIGPDWYGRCAGPVYRHGGPLVVYLMEHYGPEKFFELYHSVRPATFAADCQRILGDSWPTVEEQFWRWLTDEAEKLPAAEPQPVAPPNQTADDVELAESVDPMHWHAIVDGYRDARPDRLPLPEACAFAVERATTDPTAGAAAESEMRTNSLFVVERTDAWWLETYGPRGVVNCVLCKSGEAAAFQQSAEGGVVEMGGPRPSDPVRTAAEEYWDSVANGADLTHYQPVDDQRRFERVTRIEAIRPPANRDSSLWEIEYVQRWPGSENELTYLVQVDAAADWSVVSEQHNSADERTVRRNTLGTIFGRKVATATTSRTENDKGVWTLDLQFRELDQAEASEVREKVEAIARRGPTRNWYEPLIQPFSLAIAWPTIGMLLLGLGIVRRRREIGEPGAE